MTCVRLTVIALLALAAHPNVPAQAGPPTAEASVDYENPTPTTLRACVWGNVDDGTTVAGAWQASAWQTRSNGTTYTDPIWATGAVLPYTCFEFHTHNASGSGLITVSFAGASTAGDVTTECSAVLTHTATSFPEPVVWNCANPAEP